MRYPKIAVLLVTATTTMIPPNLSGAAEPDDTISGTQASANLGSAVASGCDVNDDGFDDVIVAAPNFSNGQAGEGAVFIFHGDPLGVGNHTPATADTTLESDIADRHLGQSVACAGDVNNDGYDDVIVGNWLYYSDDPAPFNGQLGAIYVFRGSASGIADGGPSTASGFARSDQDGSGFGWSVSGAGDVNNDGYDDVIVGAPEYTDSQGRAGSAYVFHGSSSGIGNRDTASGNFDGRVSSDEVNSRLGWSVASAGNVNNDDYDDVIVGAPRWDGWLGHDNQGVALPYFGGPSGIGINMPGTADAWIYSDEANAQMGTSVGCAGDVNGDGYDDLIAGAPDQTEPVHREGLVLVLHGAGTLPSSVGPHNASTVLTGYQGDAFFGTVVSSAGDVNNDGYDDIAVAATSFDHSDGAEGAAFVFHGSATGVPDAEAHMADGIFLPYTSYSSSWSLSGGGDTNNDGFDDLVVGVGGFDDFAADGGVAWILRGGQTGVEDWCDLQLTFAESTDPVVAGSGPGNLVYTVTVTNIAAPEATGSAVDFTLTIPAGVTLDNVTVSSGSWVSPVWTLPDLAASEFATMDLELTVAADAPNSAIIQLYSIITGADQVLINTDDDQVHETTSVVRSCDLTLEKADVGDPSAVGERIHYFLDLTNNGPSEATNVLIIDVLPSGLIFVSADPGCTHSGGTVFCSFGGLANGEWTDAHYVVEVLPSAPATVINEAVVIANEDDPNPSDNIATATTTIGPTNLIFRDDFESGDTAAWSAVVPG